MKATVKRDGTVIDTESGTVLGTVERHQDHAGVYYFAYDATGYRVDPTSSTFICWNLRRNAVKALARRAGVGS